MDTGGGRDRDRDREPMEEEALPLSALKRRLLCLIQIVGYRTFLGWMRASSANNWDFEETFPFLI